MTDSAPPRGPQPDAGTERAALGGRDDAESPHEDLADHRAEADEPAREQRPARKGSLLRETAIIVVSALVLSLLIKTFLVQAFFIPSASMEDTLVEGDRVMVSRLVPGAFDVHRGDVVVFKLAPEDVGPDGIEDLIKRVIALPGDVIETRQGVVYINDRRLDEPYLAEGMLTGDPSAGNNPPIPRQTIPEGKVFVMGDNRANSHDSRFQDRGPIPIDSIVGRAFLQVWPLGDIGGL